jgi:hypothetical protein
MALPSRPPLVEPTLEKPAELPDNASQGNRPSRIAAVARRYPALWMVAAPALLAMGVVAGIAVTSGKKTTTPAAAVTPANSLGASDSVVKPKPAVEKPRPDALAALESKPLESLSASELLALAAGRSERRLETAQALRKKIESEPGLAAKDKTVQGELLKQAADAETAREALAAMAALEGALGADLLYEVWTGTPVRNDATELARALVYSTDVRPKASPALAVALELRQAETCEQFQTALPKALKDGDRRALHLLLKLGNKRGCGPKKSQDCYACLRAAPDELAATINAVKSRRSPTVTP